MKCSLCSCEGHNKRTCTVPEWAETLKDAPKLPTEIWADWVALAMEDGHKKTQIRVKHIGGTMKDKMKIQKCVPFLLDLFDIRNRQQLDDWCLENGATKQCKHKPFYDEVERRAKEHWGSDKHPKGIVRTIYETHLDGFAPKVKGESVKTYQDENGLWKTSGKKRTSQYKGISFYKPSQKWICQYKCTNCGYFTSEIKAAEHYAHLISQASI